MSAPRSIERLAARGRALLRWGTAGGGVDAPADLDDAVRHRRVTEWPDPARLAEEECGRALVEACARSVGWSLIRRGLGDVWRELYRQLAGQEAEAGGHAIGPTDRPAPGDELEFLEDGGATAW